MTGPLAGRTAIVTGGATGIGLGIARRLLAGGASVLVSALTTEQLDRPELAPFPSYVGDLSRPGVAEDLVATATEILGGVHILVNNAGGGVIRPTLEHTEDTLQATIDNNLWTTIRCTLAVLPRLAAQGGGRIINIGAESVRNGLTDHAIYNAAKGGVHAMTTGLAREFAHAGRSGVRHRPDVQRQWRKQHGMNSRGPSGWHRPLSTMAARPTLSRC